MNEESGGGKREQHLVGLREVREAMYSGCTVCLHQGLDVLPPQGEREGGKNMQRMKRVRGVEREQYPVGLREARETVSQTAPCVSQTTKSWLW